MPGLRASGRAPDGNRSNNRSPTPPGVSSPSSSAVAEGRFPAGTVLAKRYRILGLIGRGGMGEVYRANDTKLGQLVARPDDLAVVLILGIALYGFRTALAGRALWKAELLEN